MAIGSSFNSKTNVLFAANPLQVLKTVVLIVVILVMCFRTFKGRANENL